MNAQDGHTEKGFSVTGTAPAPAGGAVADGDPGRGRDPECGHHHGYLADKDGYLKRLRRIEGQVRGLQRMVDDEQYCIDILTQVAAVSKALHAVSLNLLEEHIGHCVTGAAVESERTGDPTIAEAKVKEATAAISRLMRS